MLNLMQRLQEQYSSSIKELLNIRWRYPFGKQCLQLIQFLSMLQSRFQKQILMLYLILLLLLKDSFKMSMKNQECYNTKLFKPMIKSLDWKFLNIDRKCMSSEKLFQCRYKFQINKQMECMLSM